MADKNIQIKSKNGGSWDNLYPKTKASIVVLEDGTTNVTAKITALETAIGAKITSTEADTKISAAIANLIDNSPEALNTLKELATALGNDSNFATTIANAIATKAPIVSPTFTGTPSAPTALKGTNTTQIATTAFVKTACDDVALNNIVVSSTAPTAGNIWYEILV